MDVGIVLMCVDCVLSSPKIAQADPGRRTPPRGGSVTPLTWDEWYKPFIRHAGFLSLARLINTHDLPLMDSAALTALVDRWRLEMLTFHLPCGETTVTL
jgi:hypothetical protein